jgi:hypothetical protein
MSWIQLRENREQVLEALSTGHADEVVMCQATAFDELAAAMHTFRYWEQLEVIEADLDEDEDDVPNELLLRELAVRGSDRHLAILQQGGNAPPFVVNWRVQGPGKELEAGRIMVREVWQAGCPLAALACALAARYAAFLGGLRPPRHGYGAPLAFKPFSSYPFQDACPT